MANQSRRPRDLAGPSGQDDVRAGNLEVRLAATVQEVDAAQALRYRVFYDEMGAKPSPEALVSRRDRDRFDEYCDHLLVIDHGRGSGSEAIVGTYRLLRRSIAERQGGFYTATEFDITPLLAVEGELLELGRSCVEAAYRTRPTMQLLWRGIGEYCFRHDIKLMFGCASLPGTDTRELAPALTYLHHYHLAPPALRARALPERYVAMDLLRLAEVDTEAAVAQIVKRATVSALPPLIKGYLRLGALIGEGAVIDHEFGTTDVCIIVVTDRITDKYFNHYIRGR
jgi:putative hemolysin